MTDEGSPLDCLRRICLGFPEATEKEAWGDPTFRIRNRIFAMMKLGDGRVSVWLKAAEGMQQLLVEADERQFFRPPYVGQKGWIGIRLDDDPDWDHIAYHIRESYLMAAPKSLRDKVA
ncbi:MmcQ/YjbR family DNA-binding protein [Aurantimonas sp. E1-2-R+4]|uniref:MmcQ/YjbR family DNA-binding protein n=1 Tax=Aurantimonas sp. E1-2-R+4 TaxID=3113714 RepID=UPI002F94C054